MTNCSLKDRDGQRTLKDTFADNHLEAPEKYKNVRESDIDGPSSDSNEDIDREDEKLDGPLGSLNMAGLSTTARRLALVLFEFEPFESLKKYFTTICSDITNRSVDTSNILPSYITDISRKRVIITFLKILKYSIIFSFIFRSAKYLFVNLYLLWSNGLYDTKLRQAVLCLNFLFQLLFLFVHLHIF